MPGTSACETAFLIHRSEAEKKRFWVSSASVEFGSGRDGRYGVQLQPRVRKDLKNITSNQIYYITLPISPDNNVQISYYSSKEFSLSGRILTCKTYYLAKDKQNNFLFINELRKKEIRDSQ